MESSLEKVDSCGSVQHCVKELFVFNEEGEVRRVCCCVRQKAK
jgi:hypothetical protein